MFKIGDIVEITEESDATGMLDFTQGEPYRVHETRLSEYGGHLQVFMLNDSGTTGWYHQNHFKLKEDTNVEKKECLFKEGQVVWDTSYGRGAVSAVFPPSQTTSGQVQVEFDSAKGSKVWYTLDGKYQLEKGATNRTLFFSEPKIEAATEPLFEHTLKKGDVVAMVSKSSPSSNKYIITVDKEQEDGVVNNSGTWYGKCSWDFYSLGEKINFK